MEALEQRFQQLELALAASQQQAQAAEARAQAAEDAANAAAAAAAAPRTGDVEAVGSRALPSELIDTRLLAKPKAFGGIEEDWPAWSFKMMAYLSALDHTMTEELLHAVVEPLEDVRNSKLLLPAAQARSRQLYFILVLLLEGQALLLIKPVGVGEGYRAWRVLQDQYEPDRPGRHAGLLQELIGFQFPQANVTGALADFEYRLTKYESQSKEKVGDIIKMAILQRGMQDEQLKQHLVLHAARLTTWEAMRSEVSMVITTRQALQTSVPMDVTAIQAHHGGKD